MNNVTVGQNQLFIINSGVGVSCFGFRNAHSHASHIAGLLNREDLAPGDSDYGTLQGYEKYQRAIHAWGESGRSSETYFDPDTPDEVRRILSGLIKSRSEVRLIYGDVETGRSWLDENDVVGVLSRSTGLMKIPLLVAKGQGYGAAVLCDNILVIQDWKTGAFLYRAKAFKAPELEVRELETPIRSGKRKLAWSVLHNGDAIANFDKEDRAQAFAAFHRGCAVPLKSFQ